jgi:predicted transcriptional regulator
MPDTFISIKPKYVEMILAGAKVVELRKRSAKIAPGTRILIYATSPQKELVGEAGISFVERLPVELLFKRYGRLAGVTREDFESYYVDHSVGVAFGLESVIIYARPVSLAALQLMSPGFRPPQSYMRAPAFVEALGRARRRGGYSFASASMMDA